MGIAAVCAVGIVDVVSSSVHTYATLATHIQYRIYVHSSSSMYYIYLYTTNFRCTHTSPRSKLIACLNSNSVRTEFETRNILNRMSSTFLRHGSKETSYNEIYFLQKYTGWQNSQFTPITHYVILNCCRLKALIRL